MNGEPLTYDRFVAYAAGELAGDETARMEAWMASSPEAAARVAEIRDLLQIMRGDDSRPASRTAIDRAVATFATHRSHAVTDWLSSARRILAELVFDSRRPLALAGFRGGMNGYQLAYQTSDATIDLQVSPSAQGAEAVWQVRGQISLRSGDEVADVVLLEHDTSAVAGRLASDEHGCFKLSAGRGSYDLLVNVSAGTMLVPDLQIG